MRPEDIVVLAILLLIVVLAGLYVYRAKKKGQRCIGCPSAKTCGGKCSCGTHQNEK